MSEGFCDVGLDDYFHPARQTNTTLDVSVPVEVLDVGPNTATAVFIVFDCVGVKNSRVSQM